MKTTKVKCAECGNTFEKRNADYNRTEKAGSRHFCSRSCSVICGNKEMSPSRKNSCGKRIKTYAGNRQDEYSPFKSYLSKWRASMIRHKNEINIDVKYLKHLWDVQCGKCPYTGLSMILPKNTNEYMKSRSLKKASLDRIDSSKGYLKGNVEFVCYAINMAKNSFTREEMKEFIEEMKVVEPTGIEPVS